MRRLPSKIRVILVTDGDKVAQEVIESLAAEMGLRCLSASAGNPTPLEGADIVALLKKARHDPVLVMFDDKGAPWRGEGERALEYVAKHPDIEVLGAIAVASNTFDMEGVKTDFCITKSGKVSYEPIDKSGDTVSGAPVLRGDTVDVLNDCAIPIIIGVGDIGKMKHHDDICMGAPVTKRAIEAILSEARRRSDA